MEDTIMDCKNGRHDLVPLENRNEGYQIFKCKVKETTKQFKKEFGEE